MKTVATAGVIALFLSAAPAVAAELTTLYRFTSGGAGSNVGPRSTLTIDAAGNLYGSTYRTGSGGAGVVFKLNRQQNGYAGAITTLATFAGSGPGPRYPGWNPLVLDRSGNLYGATQNGGPNDYGSMFKIAAGSNTLTTIFNFENNTTGPGYSSRGPIVLDAAGALWGTSTGGGKGYHGTLWRLDQGATQPTKLADFDTGGLGSEPNGGLVADSMGNMYGTTYFTNGTTGSGTVFKVAAGTGQVTKLATLGIAGDDPRNPFGALVLDAAGNLYGTTQNGGTGGVGAIFKVAAGSNTVSTLANFDNSTTGGKPYGGLIVDAAGNLFGTTYSGGGLGVQGTVFRLDSGSSQITTLASFGGTNGTGNSYGSLVADASGILYGTTSAGYGSIFQVTNSGYVVGASAAVPEPANWALMLVGFGAIGCALRSPRRVIWLLR